MRPNRSRGWITLVLAAMILALLAGPAVAAVLVVDQDGTYDAITDGCSGSDTAHTTISSALTAAADGDTVKVCAGTYTEQLSVTTPNIMIIGDDATTTVVKPTLVSANTSSLFSGAPIAAIILVDGVSGVTIRDLTVDGSTAAFNNCSPGYMGIFYRAASGTIDSTRVSNILHPLALGCQGVLGIFVQSANGGPGLNANVSVTGNTVDNYGKNGVTANEAGTAVAITDNTVVGRGSVGEGDAAQNGIQVGFGARGFVARNTITGNDYTPTRWTACGLLFYNAGGGLGRAKSNTFSGNEQDFCNSGTQPSVHSPFND